MVSRKTNLGSPHWRHGGLGLTCTKAGGAHSMPTYTDTHHADEPEHHPQWHHFRPARQRQRASCGRGKGDPEASEHAGLLLVVEAMRDCGRPAVGHAVCLDLVFLLQALSAPLPRTWSRFRRHANSWFPGGLYDSKHIASCIPEVGRTSVISSSSALCTYQH